MAEKEDEYPLGSPKEHALMCEKHKSMPVDVTCEDCESFIFSNCVKEDVKQLDEKILKASQKLEESKKRCDIEILKLQNHYDAIVEKLTRIKEKKEKTLRDSLETKTAEISRTRSSLEEKKKNVLQCVKSLKENSSMIAGILLLKTHRELTKLLSIEEDYTEKLDFLVRYEGGDVNESELEYMMGETFDAEQITVTETDSFQWGDEPIAMIEAINEDTCLLRNNILPYFGKVKKSGMKEKQFSVNVHDVCVTDNNEVYVTVVKNKSISRLSPSGSVSTVLSTDPLVPMGIFQTTDGGLLSTLVDTESDLFQPDSRSRRLVKHVTLTGDVIREYEYQKDGQTRLFTLPSRVAQNGNTDICVINWTSNTTGELVIFSFSGSLKTIYPEQNQRQKFMPTDVVFDSHFNIVVNELYSSTIHLLSPEGRFMRYLLTENQDNFISAMSLRNSTLWIGDEHGLVKVFQYKP